MTAGIRDITESNMTEVPRNKSEYIREVTQHMTEIVDGMYMEEEGNYGHRGKSSEQPKSIAEHMPPTERHSNCPEPHRNTKVTSQ